MGGHLADRYWRVIDHGNGRIEGISHREVAQTNKRDIRASVCMKCGNNAERTPRVRTKDRGGRLIEMQQRYGCLTGGQRCVTTRPDQIAGPREPVGRQRVDVPLQACG